MSETMRDLFDEHSDHERAAGCDGKEPFATHAMALKVANRPRIKNPVKLKVYRCRFCGKYHITPPMKKKRRGPRKKRTIRF